MGMQLVEKVGKVSIKRQTRDGALYVCRWSAAAGKMLTERVQSGSINMARRRAAELNAQIKKGSAAVIHSYDKVLVKEAMETAIAASRSKAPDHQQNLQDNIRYFIEWLSRCKPGIVRWDQVTYAVLVEYIEFLRDVKKIASKTARNYCTVIGITSRYWSSHHPKLYTPLPVSHPWLSEQPEPAKNYLTPKQALDLLVFSRKRNCRSNVGILAVGLGCFAGLNLQEIANLRVGWIDAEAGVVHIKQSKNTSRLRSIPVMNFLRSILIEQTKDRDPNEFLIQTSQTVKEPTKETLSRNLDRHLLPAAAKALNCTNYLTIAPKDVRKTFANLGTAAKVDRLYLEAYFGHSAKTTFAKRYADDKLVERFRIEVVQPIEAYLRKIFYKSETEFVSNRVQLLNKNILEMADLEME